MVKNGGGVGRKRSRQWRGSSPLGLSRAGDQSFSVKPR